MWDSIKEWARVLLVLAFLLGVVSLGIYLEVRKVNACTTYLHLTTIECMMQGGRK